MYKGEGIWTKMNGFLMQKFCSSLLVGMLIVSCSKSSDADESETDSLLNHRIVESPARTPEAQKEGFQLPPGFEIELFASEPDIGKPMNMVFDLDGRLWVTQSQEYPFPAGARKGRDRITILEDTDGDGKADVFTDFADNLDIPIGILPVHDGAIAFSIPSIYHFKDSDGDDYFDEQTLLYGEFGYEDTHGMVNSFAPGFDGWIYAGHGYKNHSTVKGVSTETITMESGHTFRFQRDGSAIEVVTTGRVNPFALTLDKWGYQYSSDSHSDPIYQLIPGGDYPHFGKTPTGIGYAPRMMDHDHGPTAITGVAINDMDQFPPEYQNSLFNGNVVSNRIFRDSLAWHGATPEAVHKEEFLTSEDKWFRPVDMTMGPDGALYIADFYNRIIGHYEVPLDHEGRDRQRGRIWRITYKGNSTDVPKWSNADLKTLLEGLNNQHLNTRLRIADHIFSKFGKDATKPLQSVVQNKNNSPVQRAHSLWLLNRLNALPDNIIIDAAADEAEIIRSHTMRILGEKIRLNEQQQGILISALNDRNAHVQRTAVEAMARHVSEVFFKPLLNFIKKIPEYDTYLQHAASITLRDHLRNSSIMQIAAGSDRDGESLRILADHMIGVPIAQAASFLLSFIENHSIPESKVEQYAGHIVRYLSVANQDELVSLFREKAGTNLSVQRQLFQIFRSEMAQRGEPLGTSAQNWASDLTGIFLDEVPAVETSVWRNKPLSESDDRGIPWITDEMLTSNGDEIKVLTNRFRSGQYTGILISPVFQLEESFSSYLHIRDADINSTPDGYKLRLRLTETDEMINEIVINDKENFENRITWDVSAYSGTEAYIEVVAEVRGGHRHIAVGDFSQPNLQVPAVSPSEMSTRLQFAADITRRFGLMQYLSQLEKVLNANWLGFQARSAAANTLVRMAPSDYIPVVKQQLTDEAEPISFRTRIVELFGEETTPELSTMLAEALPQVSNSLQLDISRSLINTTDGAGLLLEVVRQGAISNEILKDPAIQSKFEGFESTELQNSYQELAGTIESTTGQNKEEMIADRLAAFNPVEASEEKGKQIFEMFCMNCHQLDQEGTAIGPQLDGIGSRGANYIAEAILAPNNTVAASWRVNNIKLKSGEVHSGLFQRKDGNQLIFADFRGNEFSIAEDQIEERIESPGSIMPDFSQVLTPEQFQDLLAYLLSQ